MSIPEYLNASAIKCEEKLHEVYLSYPQVRVIKITNNQLDFTSDDSKLCLCSTCTRIILD